jgi:hypothetical protein
MAWGAQGLKASLSNINIVRRCLKKYKKGNKRLEETGLAQWLKW